jgi:hypothetical protein
MKWVRHQITETGYWETNHCGAFFFLVFGGFETGSLYVVQAGLELMISPECWDHKYELSHPASVEHIHNFPFLGFLIFIIEIMIVLTCFKN